VVSSSSPSLSSQSLTIPRPAVSAPFHRGALVSLLLQLTIGQGKSLHAIIFNRSLTSQQSIYTDLPSGLLAFVLFGKGRRVVKVRHPLCTASNILPKYNKSPSMPLFQQRGCCSRRFPTKDCVETTELKSPTAGAPITADGSMSPGGLVGQSGTSRQQFPKTHGRLLKFLNMAASAGMG
jgi:hypothetical protein